MNKMMVILPMLFAACGCSTVRSTDDIPVVKGFDAVRYMGTWHEIARLPKYDLALVTGEDRSSLWILARTSTISIERRDMLIKMASEWGFDVSKLEEAEAYAK